MGSLNMISATTMALMSWMMLTMSSTFVNAQPPLEYLDQPEDLWERLIDGTPSNGNQIVMAPDNEALYVTTASGIITALLPDNGSPIGKFAVPSNAAGWEVSCQSGIEFHYDPMSGEDPYFVFTVIDSPPFGSAASDRKQSRVFAFNHLIVDGKASLDTPRWTSPALEGVAAGTPIISTNGLYVYITTTSQAFETAAPTSTPSDMPSTVPSSIPSAQPSSTPSKSPSQSPTIATQSPTQSSGGGARRHLQGGPAVDEIIGFFTMLVDANNGTGGTIGFQSASNEGGVVPNHNYGPLAIARNVTEGNYLGGAGNTNDVLVWHSLSDPFKAPTDPFTSETRLFQLPVEFDGTNTDILEVIVLNQRPWVTAAAPAITSDGQRLFIGATESIIHGWVNGRSLDLLPNFEVELSDDGSEAAPPNRPVLSVDEQLIFIAPQFRHFQAINISTQQIAWSTIGLLPETVQTDAVISPDGLHVYFCSGNRVYAVEATTGDDVWTTPSYALTLAPGRILSADFTLSVDGRIMYIAGIRTNTVIAMRLASMPLVTEMPSAMPTTSSPTITASPTGSAAPTSSSAPSWIPSDMPSMVPTETVVTASPSANPAAATTAPTSAPTRAPVVPTSPPTGEPGSSDDDGPNIGIIIGAVVGGVVLIGVCVFAFFALSGRTGGGGGGGRRNSDHENAYAQDDAGNYGASAYVTGGDSGGQASQRLPYPPPGGGDDDDGDDAAARERASNNGGTAGQGGASSQRRPYPVGQQATSRPAAPPRAEPPIQQSAPAQSYEQLQQQQQEYYQQRQMQQGHPGQGQAGVPPWTQQ